MLSPLGPDAAFIGAGDDVIVVADDGSGIVGRGVLADVAGNVATVNMATGPFDARMDVLAHPDSPVAKAFGDDTEEARRDALAFAYTDAREWADGEAVTAYCVLADAVHAYLNGGSASVIRAGA